MGSGKPASPQRVAVGSLNPAKVRAVEDGIKQLWPAATCIGCAVGSGVSDQPMSEDEAIVGAINRARAAIGATQSDLGVGLEGYTADTPYGMFLSAWVAIVDQIDAPLDQVGLGAGGRLQIPGSIAEQVRRGAELGPLMDQLVGQENTKQNQGAIGILTAGLVQRQEALTVGVLMAISRWARAIR